MIVRSAAVLAGAAAILGLGAGPAAAHAVLVGSTPSPSARLERAPAVVSVHFDQPVGIDAQSLAVLAPNGRRIESGPPVQPGVDLTTVLVRLPAGLADGSYAVLWRVASADGHPVSGAFSFGVGGPARPPPEQPAATADVTWLHAAGTVAAYLGVVLLVGVPFFVLAVWPAGIGAPGPRRLVVVGWWLSVVAAACLFVLQGPYGAGLGPQAAADPDLLSDTLTGRVGLLLLLRLFVLGLAVVSGPWPGTGSRATLRRDGAGLGVLVLATFALAGHPGEGELAPVSVVADAAHLAAASVWLGGLAVLLSCVLTTERPAASRPEAPSPDRPGELHALLRRWSRTAMGAVATLVATGAFQAWRQVGSVRAMRDTGYGHLLTTKLAVVLALLVLADQGRRLVARRLAVRPVLGRLRGYVAAEVAAGAVVLALTALLVGTAPAREEIATRPVADPPSGRAGVPARLMTATGRVASRLDREP